MDLRGIALTTLDGRSTTFDAYAHQVVLVVNVASRCGFTSQYAQLEALQQRYGDRGFSVLGFPSNQFLQELGSAASIAEFCSTTYGVTFPMFEKVTVNGRRRHPLYAALAAVPDGSGAAGKVRWNFEKFLVTPAGQARRFRSNVAPDDPELVALLEAGLPAA
ncbi:glutathione peroxidase [Actinotalea sp.]|uniref:glutathione peroxidase n=1 Tax=Actinotalea sp. TaxID=1872145 RepID=UPI002C4301A3|nr:glutathione peroxidase [Actinotalea sp.]HRA51713.1 glutathione peroxidase [Actinotalea sp.]